MKGAFIPVSIRTTLAFKIVAAQSATAYLHSQVQLEDNANRTVHTIRLYLLEIGQTSDGTDISPPSPNPPCFITHFLF
jgi:hypothetical protein